jgi:hypothetical protein
MSESQLHRSLIWLLFSCTRRQLALLSLSYTSPYFNRRYGTVHGGIGSLNLYLVPSRFKLLLCYRQFWFYSTYPSTWGAELTQSAYWQANGWTAGGDIFLLHSVQSRSGARPASYGMGTGDLSLGLKRQRPEADHSPPSNAEVKNDGAITPFPHMYSWSGD